MMATAQATRANAEHEQIVTQALAILKNTCNHCHAAPVLAFESRALTLAARRGYSRSDVSHRGTRANGDILYAVRSDSQPGTFYRVTVHPIARPECSCIAGTRQQPCKHAGICLGDWAERMAAAEASEQDEYAHLSREDRREMAAIAIRYHESRSERAGR